MQDRLVRFKLFGQEFTFYSNAPEEEVDAVIALLREELESDGDTFSRSSVPSSKMLVLSCLRMASKYVQLDREFDAYRQSQDVILARLLDKVVSGLS
ncbi:MAG: cell division protein ZapA [Proteobacteria bacterium]|nr:cell division protein ZapA [Pseudomonadota bacterium]